MQSVSISAVAADLDAVAVDSDELELTETMDGHRRKMKVIGKPADRIDGALKTTGRATYGYEWHDVGPNAAYGETWHLRRGSGCG